MNLKRAAEAKLGMMKSLWSWQGVRLKIQSVENFLVGFPTNEKMKVPQLHCCVLHNKASNTMKRGAKGAIKL